MSINFKNVVLETVTAGNSFVVPNGTQSLTIIPVTSGTSTFTVTINGITTPPLQSALSWGASAENFSGTEPFPQMTVAAIGGDVLLVINGPVVVGSSGSGGGGGGGSATAANQVIEINTLKGGTGTAGSVTTAVVGTNWTALSALAGWAVTFVNNTGTDLEVRKGGAGAYVPVYDGSYFTFDGLTDASNLEVRRIDTSNTQVTVSYWVNS